MQQPSTKKRVEFIDLMRGWAVIVMIETHVLNATLNPDATSGAVFQLLKFFNGLVGPSFLFASGLVYAVTTRRKINDYLSFGFPLFRQFGRLLFILSIGYVLHIPKFNYDHLVHEAGAEAWRIFFQADVLHCIAASLLLLQVLLLILRSERLLYTVVTGIAIAVVFVTPLMWSVDFWYLLPVPVASYLNGLHYSLFPLFPWSAFLFAGAVCGHFFADARQSGDPGREAETMRGMLRWGFILAGASFVLMPIAPHIYPVYNYWLYSPSFFLLRLGLVLVICTGMFRFEKARGVSARSAVTLIGRESLIVYVTHLMLIYGKLGPKPFQEVVGKTFGYPEALLATAFLLVLMYLLALVWTRLKQGPPRITRGVQLAAVAVFLSLFFFWPQN